MTESVESIAIKSDQNVELSKISVILTGVVIGVFVTLGAIKIQRILSDRKFDKIRRNVMYLVPSHI